MPDFALYATARDLCRLLERLVDETGCRLYDSYGDDRPVREYDSAEALAAALGTSDSAPGEEDAGTHVHLRLWTPAMRARPLIRRVERVHRRRTAYRELCEGWGLLVLVGEGLSTHVSWNSRTRALRLEGSYRELGPVDAWDWSGVQASADALVRVARALAVERVGKVPVLPGAAAVLAARRP